jgi:hypothetical protein
MPLRFRLAESLDTARLQSLAKDCGATFSFHEEPHEAWLAEESGQCVAALVLVPAAAPISRQLLVVRQLLCPAVVQDDGSGRRLLEHVADVLRQRGQTLLFVVPAPDRRVREMAEAAGLVCAGYQPARHLQPTRHGVLYFVSHAASMPGTNAVLLVSQVAALRQVVLGFEPAPDTLEDGVVGFPLQAVAEFREETVAAFRARRASLPSPVADEVSPLELASPLGEAMEERALIAEAGDGCLAAVRWSFDPQERSVRVLEAFATDGFLLGATMQRLLSHAQTSLSANYIELNLFASAARLSKTVEQLGFTPVAFVPCASPERDCSVVKWVKLNVLPALEELPAHARTAAVCRTVSGFFEDQRAGVAVINLLRGLSMFHGLGDGELRKVARLFQQKLFRPGDTVFVQGGAGDEAYVVMRGQVEIVFDNPPRPVAVIEPGQVFGEQAFLDAAQRTASAEVRVPTILLVIQRAAFQELAQREPHLGLVIMRNIAVELSAKLRRTNAAWVSERKAA